MFPAEWLKDIGKSFKMGSPVNAGGKQHAKQANTNTTKTG